MINVSDTFKQKLQDGERVWQEVEITFPGGTVKTVKDEIMGENCTFSDCAESSSFPIGCVVCKSMTLELDNTSDQWKNYNFYMAKVHAYLKMQTSVASPVATDELLDENYDPILDQSGGAILATKAATETESKPLIKVFIQLRHQNNMAKSLVLPLWTICIKRTQLIYLIWFCHSQ